MGLFVVWCMRRVSIKWLQSLRYIISDSTQTAGGLSGQTVWEQRMALLGSPISHKNSFNPCNTEWYRLIIVEVTPVLPPCPPAEPGSCWQRTACSELPPYPPWRGNSTLFPSWSYPLRFLYFLVLSTDTMHGGDSNTIDSLRRKMHDCCCRWIDNNAVAAAIYKDDLIVNVRILWWR